MSKVTNKVEILIVRNAVFHSRYDVVEVDFLAEQVKVIESGLIFEEAVALQELLNPETQYDAYFYEEEEKQEV